MAHLTPTPVLDPAQDKTMILNMGPQHPSTHGVLRVLLEIDGENVVRIMPDIGFLHTGIEKTCEAKFYQQVVPLTDRIDYLCPLTNNLCYVLAVEKLLGLELPPKAQWLRVLMNELTRINSHLVWLGTHALDIGAMTVFLYCFREREDILRMFEMVSGQRMMTSYFRIGGIALEPPLGFFDRVRDFASLLVPRDHDDDAFAAIRNAEGSGRPLANADFVADLEKRLGRAIARRAPGRKSSAQNGQTKLL